MSKWLLRGLVFAALMVIVRLLQGAMINAWETRAAMISAILVVAYGVVSLLWGYVDGRSDAKKNPDPERRADLAMTWLLAGLFAGVVSGAVAWIIGMFYDNLYVEGLLNELTTFAAFTALLVFLTAIAGVVCVIHWATRPSVAHMEKRITSPLGTATTTHHVKMLLQQVGQVVFCFDGDNAGREAAWRAMRSAFTLRPARKSVNTRCTAMSG